MAVRAFLMAFPPARQDVRLVVKMMNSRPELPAYQDLMRLCAADSRIIVIDKFLSREDMLALLNNADAFVSLHRAEGFGRVIAELDAEVAELVADSYRRFVTDSLVALLLPAR